MIKKKSSFKNPQKKGNFKSQKKSFSSSQSRDSFSQNSKKPYTNENFSYFEKKYNLIEQNYLARLLALKREVSQNQFVRINTSQISKEEFESFLKKNRVKFSPTFLPFAFKIEKSFFNLSSSLPLLLGEVYFQDLASQIPVSTINFKDLKSLKRTIKVLDMAASPGSKTTQIYDVLITEQIPFELTALELEKVRILRLLNNCQKQSLEQVSLFNVNALDFQSEEKYDLILLDAPCSGNLVDEKRWIEMRDEKGILERSALQKKLLKKAHSLLAQKGQLVYSTCSLEPEENEENASWALLNLDLKAQKSSTSFPFETKTLKKFKDEKFNCGYALRINPLTSKTQGFFSAQFSKK